MRNGASPTLADWIAVDWGTSRLRAWAMTDAGGAVAEGSSDAGMAGLAREEFEPALLALIEPWLGTGRTPVVASGMVGARQGWAEAPYLAAPCAPLGGDFAQVEAKDARLDIRIVPGVKQARPADVMRGEETQIAGFLSAEAAFDGVLCLPGTHTKWVHVSAGEIVSFRSFMTGEMFALLAERSVLRHSVGAGWDDAAFDEAVADALSKPEAVAARLFGIRAESLLGGLDGRAARARLSGFLIGMELAAARPYWLGREIAVIGAAAQRRAYETALAAQGAPARAVDANETTLAGLTAARALIGETP